MGTDMRAFAGEKGQPWPHGAGQSAVRERVFVGAAVGAHWHDLPERYGKWKTLHQRFARWAKAGVWERVFKVLTADRKNEYLMLDSTLVRAHQQAATGKGGTKIRLWGAPEVD
jgi:putative transposase